MSKYNEHIYYLRNLLFNLNTTDLSLLTLITLPTCSLPTFLVMISYYSLLVPIPLLVLLMLMLCPWLTFLLTLHELSHLKYLIDLMVFTITYYR